MSIVSSSKRSLLIATVAAAGLAAGPAWAERPATVGVGVSVGVGAGADAQVLGTGAAAEALANSQANVQANAAGRAADALTDAAAVVAAGAGNGAAQSAEARARYNAAIGVDVAALDQLDTAEKAVELDEEVTADLVLSGWGQLKQAQFPADGFANHGERVRTYIEIAKELGLDPAVGALQANFSLDAGLDAESRERAQEIRTLLAGTLDAAERTELEAELWALLTAHGRIPAVTVAGWWQADLDVNNDGVITTADLGVHVE